MEYLNKQKIKGIMAEKSITGVEMSKSLGISQTAFYSKISGKREFTSFEIGKMADVLKTTPNFFYNLCYDNSNKCD